MTFLVIIPPTVTSVKKCAKLAEQYNMEAEQIKAAVPQQQLSADIVTRKAVDFVVENAVKE